MLSLMKGGATVLFVSHSANQIVEICNRVVWLENGKVKLIGDPSEIMQQYTNSNA